jgi:TonB family protein
VRCSACHADPAAQNHYCECCGRKLLSEELDASGAPSDSDTTQHDGTSETGSTGRCESCGRPAGDGGLCPSCKEAFGWVFSPSEPPPGQLAQVVEASAAPEMSGTRLELPDIVASNEMTERVDVAPDDAEAPKADAFEAAKPSDTAMAIVAGQEVAPSQRPRIGRSEILALAMIVAFAMAGVLVGAFWPHPQVPVESVRNRPTEQLPSAPATNAPPASAHATDQAKPQTAAPANSTAAATPSATAAPRAHAPARKPRAARAPTKPKVEPKTAAAPQVVESALAIAPPLLPAVPTPPPAVVAQPRATVAVEAPTGRLFEAREVDEAPRVVSRVDPRLPANLAGHRENDVVVVRLLVSQSGHPFRVNLLRRSRLGAPADAAVIAAVQQWRFSPARNQGEAVACWFNVGVPLSAD